MTKGSLFWANAKGKLGQMVISRRGGEEITRAYQPNVKNPKTSGQMIQRAKFAQAVKFYKHAVENFFPFSFEDKKKNESFFNAFMRYNISSAVLASKEQTDGNYPALGAEWTLTKGSLTGLQYGMVSSSDDSEVFYDKATLFMPTFDRDEVPNKTVAEFSAALIKSYPTLKDGDIITFLIVSSDVKTATENPSDLAAAKWDLKQFILNTKDTSTIVSFLEIHAHDITWGSNQYGVSGCAVIVSRKIDENNVLVSTSTLVNGTNTVEIISQLRSYPLYGQNLKTWGVKDSDAILKGDLSINTEASLTGVSVNEFTGVKTIGSTFTVSNGMQPSILNIYGANLQYVKTEDLTVEGNGQWDTFMYDPGRINIRFSQKTTSETWDITFKVKGVVIAKISGNTGA